MRTIAIMALLTMASVYADDKDYELYNSVLSPEESQGTCTGGDCRNLKHIHNPALDPDIPN